MLAARHCPRFLSLYLPEALATSNVRMEAAQRMRQFATRRLVTLERRMIASHLEII